MKTWYNDVKEVVKSVDLFRDHM